MLQWGNRMLKKLYKMPMSADEVYKDILDKILTLKYELNMVTKF